MRKSMLWVALALSTWTAPPALAQPAAPRDHQKADRPSEGMPVVPGEAGRMPVRPDDQRRRRLPRPDFAPTGGPAGTEVVIRGRTLGPVTEVLFGGAKVAFRRAGRDEIRFVVPAQAGARRVPIVLVDADGRGPIGVFDYGTSAEAPTTPDGDQPAPPPDGIGDPVRPAGVVTGHANRRWREIPMVTDFSQNGGPSGDQVTIYGRHLGPEMRVIFGDEEIPSTLVGDRMITFVVPAGAPSRRIALEGGGRRLLVGHYTSGRPDTFVAPAERARTRRQRAEAMWKQARDASRTATRAEREAALVEREAALAASRATRRREQVDALRARWAQSFLAREEVQAELALHAERVARLERMRRLAEAGDRGPLVIRVRVAIDREAERHESRMKTLEAAFRSDEGKP
jgi:hypothetical protein